MTHVARASETPSGAGDRERTAPGDIGAVLMGSAIGIAAAIAFGAFLWMSVH